jgi:hypothetical protein
MRKFQLNVERAAFFAARFYFAEWLETYAQEEYNSLVKLRQYGLPDPKCVGGVEKYGKIGEKEI